MFFEQIGEYTKTHIRTHLPSFLENQQTLFTDKLPLVMPRTLDLSSLVGGVIQVARETLPQYAISILNKQPGTGLDNMYTYNYPGQVMLLVGGNNSQDVEQLAYRHSAAVEKLSRDHPHLHQYSDSDGFTLLYWEWQATTFSGAMQLEPEDSPVGELWVAGSQLNFVWVTSESGMGDQIG